MPPKFSEELSKATIFSSGLDFQGRTSPCEASCPAGNPIQKMNELIKEDRLEEALEYIHARNPFPGITGRVCNHPCEMHCNRNNYDEGIAIRNLELHVADHADMNRVKRLFKSEQSGKKLAIIGSGPAGMTCAYFSALFGHEVTVFEGSDVLGGMPRTGIPETRLPRHIVDREVGQVLQTGVTAKVNTVIGRDIDLEEVLKAYDACLIATGTWKEKNPDVPNDQLATRGVSFLREVNRGRRDPIGDRVVIVGGGGVAFDCAFAARRLGASEIHIVCVEDKENMVATPEDILQAEKDGIVLHHGHMISGVLTENQKASGIEFFEASSYHFENDGHLSVIPASEKKKELKADAVILAVGLEPDLDYVGDRFKRTSKGTLEVDPTTMSTSVPGVFGAGDAVNGPGTVAEAVGSGRLAAVAIHRYLKTGKPDLNVTINLEDDALIAFKENGHLPQPHVVGYDEMFDVDFFEKKQRASECTPDSVQSIDSSEEIGRGFLSSEEAKQEAGRCFHCGHCQLCGRCVEHCPGYVLEMTEKGPRVAFPDECWHCGSCRVNCPSSCIYYEFPVSMLV